MRSTVIDKELRAFFEYKKTDRLWHIPAIAALSVSVPFFVAYALGFMQDGIQASIGGLVSLYIHSGSVKRRMKVLLLVAAGFVVSFGTGLIFSYNPYISALAIAVFSMFVHGLKNRYRLPAPGNFFFIMVASIGCFMPYNPQTILLKMSILSAGALWACLLGFLYALYITRKFPHQPKAKTPPKRKDVSTVESILIGIIMGASILASHALKLPNPYWVPISCLAIIQGINQRIVWHRTIQRIIGTIIGLGIAWLLLKINHHPLFLGVCIMVLQFLIELFIVRNYGLAVIFITPMTIFLAEAGAFSTLQPDELFVYRFIDILVGAMIGALGGILIHSQKLYAHTRLQVTQTKKRLSKK
ncbi:FUSC family protein [Gynurincola endophyticus]|uniref:FUSC family protein n=1 Tax=Gynurincola endophyticus TaxID=2479004 RepID=UPI000F8E7EB8|nr:FUSC family protein [Gynurincola endophyticus]